MTRCIVFFCIFVFLSSCSTRKLPQGQDFSLQSALYVTSGMEDMDVLRLMGLAPYDRISSGEAAETWIWVYSEDGETKSFTVQFEENRVVATNIRVE